MRPCRPQASGSISVAPQPRSRTLRPRCHRGLKPGSRRITSGGGFRPPSTMGLRTELVDWPDFLSIWVLRQGRIPSPTRRGCRVGTLVCPPPLGLGLGPRNGPGRSPSGKGWRRGFVPERHPSPPHFLHTLAGEGRPWAGGCIGVCPSPVPGSGPERTGGADAGKLGPCWHPCFNGCGYAETLGEDSASKPSAIDRRARRSGQRARGNVSCVLIIIVPSSPPFWIKC